MTEPTPDAIPEMYTAYAFYQERRREERRRWRQELDERKREYDARYKLPIMNDVFGPILWEDLKEQILGKRPAVKETIAVDRSVPTPGWSMIRYDEWMSEGRI